MPARAERPSSGRLEPRPERRLLVVGLALMLVGCAAGPPTPPPAPPPEPVVTVPAGVDPEVAAYADSLAEASFVDVGEEVEAEELRREGQFLIERTDSLWLVMSELVESTDSVSEEDAAASNRAAEQGALALVGLDSLLRSSEVERQELARKTTLLLDSAEIALERSFGLNPFDTRTRMWLAQVYGLQARRLGQEESYAEAIDVLEKLTLLSQDQHSVYAMLANNHFYLSDWAAAALSYQRAEEVYIATYDLVIEDPQPLDSAVVFSYARAQGDMYVKLQDADRAVEAYPRAGAHATTAADSAVATGELEWLASLARDSLAALEQGGDLDAARDGYEDLLGRLGSPTAIDETEWRLAILDYNLGREEEAAERLRLLVERTPVDASGAPADSSYVRYFDDYGQLCLNLGRTFKLEHRDRRTALKYFTQASRLTWSGRAVAYLEVAQLVQSNAAVALENAALSLEAEDTLDTRQRSELYRLLMELHRRSGDYDQARQFRDAFRQLRGG